MWRINEDLLVIDHANLKLNNNYAGTPDLIVAWVMNLWNYIILREKFLIPRHSDHDLWPYDLQNE